MSCCYHAVRKALVQTGLTSAWFTCMSTLGYLCIYCLTELHICLACSSSLLLRGYTRELTTAHAPWSHGQTACPTRLFHFFSADMRDWDKHLKIAQFAMSNSWQESVQDTPMYRKHGRHPRFPLAVKLPTLPTVSPASADFAAHMRNLMARAVRCMITAKAEALL